MRIISVLFFFSLFFSSIHAQQFTEQIQQQKEGEGQLTINQSQSITDMVNGAVKTITRLISPASKPKVQSGDSIPGQAIDSLDVQDGNGPRIRVNGFRIQVYSGDNTRKGKSDAKYFGQRVRNAYAELPVYISFVSPHWLCRVGDFRTNEEALEYLRQMRESGTFDEAVIVKCKVNVKL